MCVCDQSPIKAVLQSSLLCESGWRFGEARWETTIYIHISWTFWKHLDFIFQFGLFTIHWLVSRQAICREPIFKTHSDCKNNTGLEGGSRVSYFTYYRHRTTAHTELLIKLVTTIAKLVRFMPLLNCKAAPQIPPPDNQKPFCDFHLVFFHRHFVLFFSCIHNPY